jgi:hypothetical protein
MILRIERHDLPALRALRDCHVIMAKNTDDSFRRLNAIGACAMRPARDRDGRIDITATVYRITGIGMAAADEQFAKDAK